MTFSPLRTTQRVQRLIAVYAERTVVRVSKRVVGRPGKEQISHASLVNCFCIVEVLMYLALERMQELCVFIQRLQHDALACQAALPTVAATTRRMENFCRHPVTVILAVLALARI